MEGWNSEGETLHGPAGFVREETTATLQRAASAKVAAAGEGRQGQRGGLRRRRGGGHETLPVVFIGSDRG